MSCDFLFLILFALQPNDRHLQQAMTGHKQLDADRKARKATRGNIGKDEINAVRLRAKSNAEPVVAIAGAPRSQVVV